MNASWMARGISGLLVLLLVAGCQAAATPTAQEVAPTAEETAATVEETAPTTRDKAETLIWAHSTEPRTIDPHIAYSGSITRNAINIYEALVRYKYGTLELEPSLATDWEASEDGKSYTFSLREGVKFQDGTDFDAEAVRFSFDRYKAIGQAYLIAPYEDAEILDTHRIKINLVQPYAPFINMAAAIWIVGPTAAEEHKTGDDPWAKEWFYDHAVGTGPYQLVRWVHEQQVELEAFEDYWRGCEEGAPRRVIHRIIKETATQRLELEGGDVDMALSLSVDFVPALEANPDVVVEMHNTLVGFYLKMVTFKGPLEDLRVRQALQYAFPYSDLIAIQQGLSNPMEGPLPAQIPYAKQYPQEHNMEKARDLLAEAGYPDGGFELDIRLTTGFEVQRQAAELLQASLGELGIELNIAEGTYGSMVADWGDPETTPDLSGFFIYPSYPDPDNFLFDMYCSQHFPPAGSNPNRYSNSTVDDLLIQGQAKLNPSERAEIYEQIQDIIVADAPDVFAANPGYLIGYRSRVQNYKYNPAFHDTIQFCELRLSRDE